MFCKQCGNEVNDKSNFCSVCGSHLSHPLEKNPRLAAPQEIKSVEPAEGMKECPNCNELIPVISIRCRNCGANARSKDENLAAKDFWGPLFSVILLIAFFLPWITAEGYNFSRTVSAFGFFMEKNQSAEIMGIFFILIFLTTVIYLGELGTKPKEIKQSYRFRGITAFLTGLGWGFYTILIFNEISGSRKASLGIGFILSFFCCFGLIISGIRTATILYFKRKKVVFRIGLCAKCGTENSFKAMYCKKCGGILSTK